MQNSFNTISVLGILPASPDTKSNGIQCYLSLLYLLRSLPGMVYTSGPGKDHAGTSHYALSCEGVYIPENILIASESLVDSLRIVILPDHIDGLECQIYDYLRCLPDARIQFVNIVLAPLAVFADERQRPSATMYDYRDSFIYFNKLFSPPGFCKVDIYQEPVYRELISEIANSSLHSTSNKVQQGKNLLIYSGKGHFAVSSQISAEIKEIRAIASQKNLDFALITRTWPHAKQEYLQTLKNSAGLILLDPFTNVIRDALMLGVPVFCPMEGIDYDCYGVTSNAKAFVEMIGNGHEIQRWALDRHFRLARFNHIKQSLFCEAINRMLRNADNSIGEIVVPYSPDLLQASMQISGNLRMHCVVGSLSTATHAIHDAQDALDILANSEGSEISIQYRQTADEYFARGKGH